MWQSRRLKPVLSRALDGCCQWYLKDEGPLASSKCSAKSGKVKANMRELLPHSTPSLQWASAQGFPGISVFNSPGSSFPFEFLCFSGKCESLASTNFCGNEFYSLITPCVKCVPPFDAKTPTHSCICWALLRHHSRRRRMDGAVPEGSRLPQQSFVPPRQLCSFLAHAARAKAALWVSCRFSSGFCQQSGVRSLFISEHHELSCVKVLLQMRQLWFACGTNPC